jgi:hypothetical protein
MHDCVDREGAKDAKNAKGMPFFASLASFEPSR